MAVFSLCVVVCVSLSIFFASSAVTESDSFSIVFIAGFTRLLSVLFVTIYVSFSVRRLNEREEIAYMLSKPIGRAPYLMAYCLFYTLLAFLIAVLITLVLLPFSQNVSLETLSLWFLSFFLELALVAIIGFIFSMIRNGGLSGLFATLGLYVLGRLSGGLLKIAGQGDDTAVNTIFEPVFYVLALVIPRFDLLAQTGWLVYGIENFSILVFIQIILFSVLLIMAGLYDLRKKQF